MFPGTCIGRTFAAKTFITLVETRETAAFGDGRKYEIKIWGVCGAPNGLRNLRRAMRIPNMCLVLKFDNGKVVSIADEQTDVF